jgi:hypothetical protein
MKKSTTTTTKSAGASYQPIPTLQETTNAFISSQPKSRRSEGKNENLQDFLRLAEFITKNYPSFDQNTFLQASRSLDLDPAEVVGMFHEFVEQLVSDGHYRKLAGCYSMPVYHRI